MKKIFQFSTIVFGVGFATMALGADSAVLSSVTGLAFAVAFLSGAAYLGAKRTA